LEIGPLLEGHLPRFSAIQTQPCCRFHPAVDFPGLRRSGSWSPIISSLGTATSANWKYVLKGNF
jgi:hypothetical protein